MIKILLVGGFFLLAAMIGWGVALSEEQRIQEEKYTDWLEKFVTKSPR
ncbi:MAG: hypothetical protein AABY22_30455 [Nanoarchaeota archaeon]|mgnify:CR=1 FL=1